MANKPFISDNSVYTTSPGYYDMFATPRTVPVWRVATEHAGYYGSVYDSNSGGWLSIPGYHGPSTSTKGGRGGKSSYRGIAPAKYTVSTAVADAWGRPGWVFVRRRCVEEASGVATVALQNPPDKANGQRTYSGAYTGDLPGDTYARSQLDTSCAWAAAHTNTDTKQWMQVDLGRVHRVVAVVMQGRSDQTQMITKYQIETSPGYSMEYVGCYTHKVPGNSQGSGGAPVAAVVAGMNLQHSTLAQCQAEAHAAHAAHAVRGPQEAQASDDNCPTEAGKGWTLVRRTSGNTHRADDRLAGTATYGTASTNPLSASSFSVGFEVTVPGWNEIMLSTGTCNHWMVRDRA